MGGSRLHPALMLIVTHTFWTLQAFMFIMFHQSKLVWCACGVSRLRVEWFGIFCVLGVQVVTLVDELCLA